MIGATEVFIFVLSGLLIVLIKCIDKNPPPIFGIYERKNGRYWLKVAIMYWTITLLKIKREFKQNSHSDTKTEKPQPLPTDQEKASDIVTLKGANQNGDHLIVHFGKKHEAVEGYFFLKIKNINIGVLASPKFPDGNLSKADESQFEYSSEGLKLIPLEPMKKWRLLYKGTMKEITNNKEHDVKIDGVWNSVLPVCNFEDYDAYNFAQWIAYEKWSSSYFENLKKFHINYYEQFGFLQLKVTIDGKSFDIELDTARGHGIGNNVDQSYIYKACIHQFKTINGDYFRIDHVCAPNFGSRMLWGFVYKSKAKKLYPVKESSLQLYKFGGIDASPDDYGFSLTAGDKNYTVLVKVQDSPYIYLGRERNVKTYPKMSSFEVNGKAGWGSATWVYRNIEGKKV